MRSIAYRACIVTCLCMLGILAKADTNESFEANVVNPSRAFGYSLGDILEQTISLQRGDNTLTLAALPQEQREGRWVTRSHVSVSPDSTALTIRYQLVNAPTYVRLIKLPEIILQTSDNVDIKVPAFAFSIAPVIPAVADEQTEVPVMQSDWQPELPSSNIARQNIKTLLIALATSLLLWLLWFLWRNWREAHSLPFALAYKKLRGTKAAKVQNDADSWLALHNAFNRSARRSIAGGSVPALLSAVPWLTPLESDIKTFFDLSSARFFSSQQPQQSFDLKKFAKRLYTLEKQNNNSQNKPAFEDITSS